MNCLKSKEHKVHINNIRVLGVLYVKTMPSKYKLYLDGIITNY